MREKNKRENRSGSREDVSVDAHIVSLRERLWDNPNRKLNDIHASTL